MERKRMTPSGVRIAIALNLFFVCSLIPAHGWAGQAAALPPELAGLVSTSRGEIVVKNFIPAGRGEEPIDLTRYFPLDPGSWWSYTTYLLNGTGWHVYDAPVSIVDTQDMGGGVIASAVQYPEGEVEWMGWSSLGLLLFSVEEPDFWSGVYRIPQYVVYSSMAVGSTCSGSSIVDLFIEPQHTFYDTATSAKSHTLHGTADVTLPTGEFPSSAILSYESRWQEPGYPEYEKGLMVLGRDVGPIFVKALEVWAEEGEYGWAISISVLSDYDIAPPP